MGRWKEDDAYIPQIGDVLYYDWHDGGIGDCTGAPDHVGIVTDVTGKRLCIVEGNKGTKSEVATRTVMVNGRYIRGYGCPDYAALVEPEACRVILPVLQRGEKCVTVRALQALLNLRGFRLEVDGSYGPLTEQAVRTWQKRVQITVTGKADASTWASLLEADGADSL